MFDIKLVSCSINVHKDRKISLTILRILIIISHIFGENNNYRA